MSPLSERQGYDRARSLAGARKAAVRGQHVKAIAHYQRVHLVEPENTELLRRLAGQRARAGQRDEAWRDCRAAAERLAARGFVEQAIGVYRDFATHIPRQIDVWRALSDLELERGRPWDAIQVLLEGRRCFRSQKDLREALLLLQRARKLAPNHFEANFDLAGLLARCGARKQAKRILSGLEPHTEGRELRRLRGRMFRLSPSPRSAGRWLVALVRG